ncbi:hypothetical protein GCM10009530_55820 [Microbispora corallina]|uniref:Uncharacterized protein n=1 Tax=Microbispora corallina TaxID=83302 RepID=A0ABQ4GC88_9ACTN|nr:hypothetical protein [Microbispora corallina]GIH44657.1 hypothetical protein Mco01_76570 [Microbispora corallina]
MKAVAQLHLNGIARPPGRLHASAERRTTTTFPQNATPVIVIVGTPGPSAAWSKPPMPGAADVDLGDLLSAILFPAERPSS